MSIGFDFFVTDMAMQLRFIEALDTGFTNGLSASVFNGIERLRFFFIDPTDITNRMGEMGPKGIVPDKLRLDINTRQTKFINRQDSDLLLRQLIKQGDRCERMPGLLHRLVEYRAVFSRQVQQVDDFVNS